MSAITLSNWSAFLKFNGRAPRTLEEVAAAKADYDHKCRLASIKSMSTRLAILGEFDAALVAAGITLSDRQITSYDSGKTLRIEPPVFEKDDKLFAALIALGFKEIERINLFGREDQVTLKHGRWLQVTVDVTKAVEATS